MLIFKVVLAKEAGLCYAAMALVTDYDSWRDGEESVSICVLSVNLIIIPMLISMYEHLTKLYCVGRPSDL